MAALVAGATFALGYWLGLRHGRFDATAVSAPPQDSETVAALRQNLRRKLGYDEARVKRLIEYERSRLPGAPLPALMEAAIERWERDNR